MPFFIQQPPSQYIEFIRTDSFFDSQNQKERRSKNLNLDKDLIEHVYLKERFLSLKKLWEAKTMFTSSISNIIEDPNFKKIVQMGNKAIPFIIDELEKKPSTLVWALNLITNATIKSNSRLTVSDACNAWVKLYKSGKIS
ncbi:MAG TPA: hypothetical protein VNZ49_11845 [Bacteroidia bacterium]|jgi:hypothetical protein|nr:hypothetical protein [Bacteroidia bacterium]